MKYLNKYSLFNESKNYQNLYHILNFNKLKYVILNNHLKPYQASNSNYISFTRDKMMNSYLGDGAATFFKLEINAKKLSHNYKIIPFSYTSKTNVRFEESEEMIKTKNGVINNIDLYVTKLIIIKENIEQMKRSFTRNNFPSDFFTTASTRLGSMPQIIKYIVDNSPFDIYVQEGSVIKRDNDYINSLIDYKLHKVEFKYDIWFRGVFKHDSVKGATTDTIVDSSGVKHNEWAIGEIFNKTLKVKDKKNLILDIENKIIDGVECKPYIMKFRVVDNGYYLDDAKPIDWLNIETFFGEEPINEWVSNQKLNLSYMRNMINNIQSKSKNKITNKQLKKDVSNNRSFKFEFNDIIDHIIFEKILKQYQNNLSRNGILISYMKYDSIISDLVPDTLDIINTRKSGNVNFTIHIKDLYTERVKPPRYIFHYSKEKNRDSILKNGLKTKSFNEGNWEGSNPDLYYPSAIFALTDTTVVWESDKYVIDTKGLSNKWWKDLNFFNKSKKSPAIMTFSDIPVEHIRLSNSYISDYSDLFK